jgi:hypothetical protein
MPKGIYIRIPGVRKYKGDKCKNWKGDKAKYRAKHSHIERYYGKPTTCEHCWTTNLTGHKIHWASKTKEYTRDRENWLRLCVKCHHLYDRVNKLRKNYE